MNQGMAAGMTLLLASVSGFAVWQNDAHATPAAAEPPVVSPPAESMAPPRAPQPAWWREVVRQLRDRELRVDWDCSEHAISLRIRWCDPMPAVAVEPR